MKLITYNVNGIRAAQRKGFLDFLEREQPDVIGIQEIKAKVEQLDESLTNPDGYHAYYYPADRPGYSGTAILSKVEPEEIIYGLEDDEYNGEGRVMTAHYKDYTFITTYIPNGKDDMSRVDYKIEFSEAVMQHAQQIREKDPKRPVLINGDINTAHTEIDLARPKENAKKNGFSPKERDWVSRIIDHDYIDAFRYVYPEKTEIYSWWSYRGGAKERNAGWRIDYFFVNSEVKEKIKDAYYLKDEDASDHCPMVLEIDI